MVGPLQFGWDVIFRSAGSRMIRRRTLGVCLATACFTPLAAPAQTTEPRSVFSRTDRPVDELRRPRYNERETHRGWEVTDAQISVTATTSRDDARRAAGVVRETWSELGRVADAFTKVHRDPNFGVGLAQVLISDQPPRERDLPQVAFNVNAGLNRVMLNVAPDRPPLDEQIPLLRAASAQMFLRVTDLDRQLPDWVCDGLAQSMVTRFDGPEAAEAVAAAPKNADQGDQLRNDRWRLFRIAPDRLDDPPRDETKPSPAMVSYLLFGDDAKHAPAFLEQVHEALGQIRPDRALKEFDPRRQPPPEETKAIDRMAAELQPAYERWLESPDADLPRFSPSKNADEEMAARERELFVVLKLAERLAVPANEVKPKTVQKTTFAAPGKTASAPKSSNPNVVKPKVVEFTPPIKSPSDLPAAPAQPKVARAERASGVRTIGELIEKLDDRDGTWAVIDADGGLLLSIHRDRLEQLSGEDGTAYRSRIEGGNWVWSTELPNGRSLDGWLEPKSPTEPVLVSRFEVRTRR